MADQELPDCWRHPDKKCPGECQYVLPSDVCWQHAVWVESLGINEEIRVAQQEIADMRARTQPLIEPYDCGGLGCGFQPCICDSPRETPP